MEEKQQQDDVQKKKAPRGGARPGAGRKPVGDKPKAQFTVYVQEETKAALLGECARIGAEKNKHVAIGSLLDEHYHKLVNNELERASIEGISDYADSQS